MAGTLSAAGGVFLHILKIAKPQKELGHKMSDFAICELVDRWHQKKRMENLQMRNSQIAIAEIWDTPPPSAHLRDFWREKNIFFFTRRNLRTLRKHDKPLDN